MMAYQRQQEQQVPAAAAAKIHPIAVRQARHRPAKFSLAFADSELKTDSHPTSVAGAAGGAFWRCLTTAPSSRSPLCVRFTICTIGAAFAAGHVTSAIPSPTGGAIRSNASTTTNPATKYDVNPRMTLHSSIPRNVSDGASTSRERNWKRRPTLYVPPGSARSENLACGDDNVAAQSIGVELKIDLGIECARKIALDHHAAESLYAPAL